MVSNYSHWIGYKGWVFWIISADELLRYDPRNNSQTHIKHQDGDPNSYYQDAFLTDVFVDRDQNIWLSTAKGISMLKRQDLTFHNHSINKSPAMEVYQAKR
jgi:hypothetical protein